MLTKKESEDLFFNSLCNSLGHVSVYGLDLRYDEELYRKLRKEGDSFEDVLMSILRGGGTLTLIDTEGETYNSTITLQDVHTRVCNTPFRHLVNAINEEDDAETGDAILQTVFFKEVIFG